MGNKVGQSVPAENVLKPGLSGSAVKYIGIVLMVFDHLYQMFCGYGVPLWFTWIGRPVLPIFLFMCAEGFWYTHSRSVYLIRLLVCFLLMSAADLVFSLYLPVENVELTNNVFSTMFLAALYMLFIELFRTGIREKRPARAVSGLALIFLTISAYLALVLNSETIAVLPRPLRVALFGFVPNLFATEGGFTAVILGVLFYLFRKRRPLQALILVIFSALSAFMVLSSGGSLFDGGAQWLMILALVPILLYNGQRGRGGKYFFYIFYPAHIFLFYIIAWVIGR